MKQDTKKKPSPKYKVINKPVTAKDADKKQAQEFKQGWGCRTING